MYRGLINWMRVVLPVDAIVMVSVGGDLAIEVLYLTILWWNGFVDESIFRELRFFWLSICAAVYGVYRITIFHPLANLKYRAWLEQSPWTPDRPLPGGPLHLVLQDLVVISVLCLLYRIPSLRMLYFPTIFLFWYQLALAISARIVGHWKLAYLMGFILGAIVLFCDRPDVAFVIADAGIIVSRFVIAYALRTFPWELPWQVEVNSFQEVIDGYKSERLGWPYDQMSPKAPVRNIPVCDGVCLSFLIGWWWIVALEHLAPEERASLISGTFMLMIIGSVSRAGCYAISNHWPINFLGRLFTLRWIIPGYDKILIAPLFAVIVGIAIQLISLDLLKPPFPGIAINPQNPHPGIVVSGLGVTSYFLVIFLMGPTLQRWRLNGKHRIVFDLATKGTNEFVEL